MKENIIQKKIQLEFSKLGHRLFRNNVAVAWVGESAHFTAPQKVFVYPGDVIIRRARPLHAGLCEGSSDGIGWTSDGRFLACEIKTETGKPTDLQMNFITAVNRAGGVGFIAHSVEEALDKIKC